MKVRGPADVGEHDKYPELASAVGKARLSSDPVSNSEIDIFFILSLWGNRFIFAFQATKDSLTLKL